MVTSLSNTKRSTNTNCIPNLFLSQLHTADQRTSPYGLNTLSLAPFIRAVDLQYTSVLDKGLPTVFEILFYYISHFYLLPQ